jgi:carbon storage regulator
MLVLSRRENERIKLGDSIVVTVVRVSRDKVRLGIEAPSDMLVLREELDAVSTPGTAAKAVSPVEIGANRVDCTKPASSP